jgi:hypothetical protein
VVRYPGGLHRIGALLGYQLSSLVKFALISIKNKPGTGHAYAVLHNFLFHFFTFTAGETP